MLKHYRHVLTLVLLAVAGAALAQGMSIGSGVDDLRHSKTAVAVVPVGPPCDTSFVFDWTDATGCQAITAVIR